MITIHATPPGIGFSGNRMLYLVSSSNAMLESGTLASWDMIIKGTETTAGGCFTLTFAGKTLLFIIVDGQTDESGLQLPAAQLSDTFDSWGIKLFQALKSNYYLDELYAVTTHLEQDHRTINFQARTAGLFYNIAMETDHIDQIEEYLANSGVDPVYRNNFGILCNIYDCGGNKIAQEVKGICQGSSLYYADFDLSEYISSQLALIDPPKFNIAMPQGGDFLINSGNKFLFYYYCSFAEKFDGAVLKLHWDEARCAIAGGLSRERLALNEDYFSDPALKKKFLTWIPSGKLTGAGTKERLFYLINEIRLPETIHLKVKVFYSNGETLTVTKSEDMVIPSKTVLECIAGYNELGLPAFQNGRTPTSYEVWIQNTDTPAVEISEKYLFVLDKGYYQNVRTFIYRNSFSVYDVVRFTGVRECTIENGFSSAIRYILEPPTSFNAPTIIFNSSELQKFRISSGWISMGMKDCLRDFLLSTERYEISGAALLPLNITSAKHGFDKDDESIYSLDIEYERAYSDSFFSRLNQ